MPKLSVILPAYSHENYIGQTLDSILSQSFSELEIIAVNDGSPDRCGQICDNYTVLGALQAISQGCCWGNPF